MRKYMLAGATAALMTSGAAMAAPPPTVLFTPGVYTVPAYTTAAVFEDFNNGGVANGGQFTTPAVSPYTETKTGDVRVYPGTQNQPGVALQPDGSPDAYLAIVNGTFNVAFGAGVTLFSFSFGSLDNYNTVAITTTDGSGSTVTTYSGLGITTGLTANNTAPGATPAPFAGPNNTGRITYDTLGLSRITNVAFSSTQAAFEIDALAAAVPEPATWGLMILGFGLAGAALRVRRRKVAFAAA
ncbi:PEPxxWA-CTERM sorting domain-containing protein [Sphingomonas sp.]|uniref:PEPxxWA-CTERM sorting domain-containing protein n=1 Tax=Sphingomonas sp. TaxID=28214 RepID=UPI003CC56793